MPSPRDKKRRGSQRGSVLARWCVGCRAGVDADVAAAPVGVRYLLRSDVEESNVESPSQDVDVVLATGKRVTRRELSLCYRIEGDGGGE